MDLSEWNGRAQALFEVLLCSSVPTQLAIGAILHLVGWAATDPTGQMSLRFVVTLSLVDTALLISLMALLLRLHGESSAALWLGIRPAGREALAGMATAPVLFIAVGLLLNALRLLMPGLHNVATNPLEAMAATPGQTAMFTAVAIMAGGLREELQRAFLLRRFEQHLGGAVIGGVLVSVAFGLGHWVQGWDAVITTGSLGAFWAAFYLRRRSSVAPVVSHAAFNTLEILRVAMVGQ